MFCVKHGEVACPFLNAAVSQVLKGAVILREDRKMFCNSILQVLGLCVHSNTDS